MGNFDRPGEFEGVPEGIRQEMLNIGLLDMGGGKTCMEVDETVVDACRDSREYCEAVIRKTRALAQNIKDNGADFETTWAGFMALAQTVDSVKRGSYVLFAYLMAERAFQD
jgi:glutamate dehydrogenase/leucine dehydrogenase